MADGVIRLGVELDFSNIYKQIEEVRQAISSGQQALDSVREDVNEGNDTVRERKLTLDSIKAALSGDTSGLKDKDKEKAELMDIASEGFKKGSEGLMSVLRTSFEIISNIYKEMKQASPLLQAVEQIFQLAWTLFFMPLGNKLGELLIPAVLELLDGVIAIWDTIGEGNLGDIFMGVIQQGVILIGEFFKDMGEELSNQGGLLGQIGRLLQAIGNFIESGLLEAISAVLTVITAMVSHIGTIITLITTFMALHYALQIATMATIATSGSIAGWLGAGVAVAGVAGAAIGIGLSNAMGLPMAEGGIVPARDGGTPIIAGEAGEDEFIIPMSKVGDFVNDVTIPSNVRENAISGLKGQSSNNTYNIYINGYTDSELKQIVEDIVSEQISRSHIRGGF